jgi:FKBP-type peptidyl-prolyl cis-trans isomerases 2
METNQNKNITVAYKLYAVDEEGQDFIEEATVEQPFQFISGLGGTLEAFEGQVIDLKPGDKFEFTIPSDDAYGEYVDEHVIDLPKNIFEVDGRFDEEMIQEGKIVPLMNAEGQKLQGTVLEVNEDVVIMDMNHPLAGADLLFVGEVVENRLATPEEIQGMINMMSSEGCGCGSCDGDCGDDGCGGHDHSGCGGCGH